MIHIVFFTSCWWTVRTYVAHFYCILFFAYSNKKLGSVIFVVSNYSRYHSGANIEILVFFSIPLCLFTLFQDFRFIAAKLHFKHGVISLKLIYLVTNFWVKMVKILVFFHKSLKRPLRCVDKIRVCTGY